MVISQNLQVDDNERLGDLFNILVSTSFLLQGDIIYICVYIYICILSTYLIRHISLYCYYLRKTIIMTRWWCQVFFLMFTPNFGEMTRLDEHIFSKGLVQPPTR